MTVYVVLRCYGSESGSVIAETGYLSPEAADKAVREYEAVDRAKTRDVYDCFWVEAVDVVDLRAVYLPEGVVLTIKPLHVPDGVRLVPTGVGNP